MLVWLFLLVWLVTEASDFQSVEGGIGCLQTAFKKGPHKQKTQKESHISQKFTQSVVVHATKSHKMCLFTPHFEGTQVKRHTSIWCADLTVRVKKAFGIIRANLSYYPENTYTYTFLRI